MKNDYLLIYFINFRKEKLTQSACALFFLISIFSFSSAHIFSQTTRTSVQSGNWTNNNTWDCGCVPAPTDNAVIASGHTVTLLGSAQINDITIQTNAVLNDNGQANTVTGNFLLNGVYAGSGNLTLNGTATTIDGTGSIANTGNLFITNNKTILSTTDISKNSGVIQLSAATTVINNGTITMGGSITGLNAVTSVWTNAANSTLNIGTALLTTGILNSSASGNTVNYYGSVAQTIVLPSLVSGLGAYYNLTLSGTNTKTLSTLGDFAVNGNLQINSILNVGASNRNINLRGNWINTATFTAGTGTITIDGTGNQSITNVAGESFYKFTVNKPTGVLTLNNNAGITNTFAMTSGNIDVGTNKITLGISTVSTGVLNWTSGTIIGKFERWINSTGVGIRFPVGTSSSHRPLLITFTNLTAGSLIAEFISTAPGNNGLPLTESALTFHNTFGEGYWPLTVANSLASNNYNLELTGNGFTSFSILAITRLLTRATSANPWTLNGTHVNAVGNIIKRNNLNLLSAQYAFGDTTNCTAPATSAITGSTSVCRNDVGIVYSVTNNPPNTYLWNVTGGTIASGQGTNSITVNWGATGMAGNVSVVESSTCTQGAAVNLAVDINAIAPASIAGNLNVPELGTPETYSVVVQGGYTYTWNVTGGTIASGQGTNSITVNWGIEGVGTVCVVGNHACGISASTCININIFKFILSVQTGNWNNNNTWDCSCHPASPSNVRVRNTHTVTLTGNENANHFIIDAGGVVNTGAQNLTVNGDFTVDGILSGTGTVFLPTGGTNIDGTGTISNTGAMTMTGSKTILFSTALTKNTGTINISAGAVITNNGTITFGGNIVGATGTSTWLNAANSILNASGALLITGVLNAMAPDNTVSYKGAGAQAIKTPNNSGQYCNLIFLNGGIKTAPLNGSILVSGNFTNNSAVNAFVHNGCTFEFNGTSTISETVQTDFKKIIFTGTATAPSGLLGCAGDWVNNGTFNHNNGTVIFNGTSVISGASINSFNNVTISAASTLTCPPANVNVAGNWTNDNTFNNGGGTITFNGSAAQFMMGGQPSTFNNLTISNTGGNVTLSVAQFVNGYLNLNTGKIIASNLLTLNSTASSNEGSSTSFVDGAMKKIGNTAYVFPLGNNNKWARLAISAPTNPTTEFTARYFFTDHLLGHAIAAPLTDVSGLEYWTLSRAVTADNVTLKLYWENATQSQINNCPTLTIAHWTGAIWVEEAATTTGGSSCAPAGTGTVLTNAVVTSFSPFTFGSRGVGNPLPVELVSFAAECEHGHVDVTWSTASEINNDYFSVEQSVDAINWTEVHREPGAGNSNQLLSYHFTDHNPAEGQSYYRLKQTDFNGTSETFSPVSINSCTPSEANTVLVYPNPAIDMITIDVNAEEDHTNSEIRIYDMMGRNILTRIVNIMAGDNKFIIDGLDEDLAGNYSIVIQSDGHHFPVQKLVIH